MPGATAKPFVMRSILFDIDGTTYQCAIRRAEFVPDTATVDYEVLCPDGSGTDVGATKWSLEVEAYQSWEADSLASLLFENHGKAATVMFRPKGDEAAADNPMWTAEVTLPPPGIGGTVNEMATFTVTMGVKGEPEIDRTVTP
jgi:hypothetical protein